MLSHSGLYSEQKFTHIYTQIRNIVVATLNKKSNNIVKTMVLLTILMVVATNNMVQITIKC